MGGNTSPGGLGRPVAFRPDSCIVPPLDVPMAALTGLAAARSRGEYTSACMLAAAVLNGLNSIRSPGVPGVVRLKVSPSMFSVAKLAASVNAVACPSDRRTTWPAVPVVNRIS
ncbi:hypothetical protein D3C71_1558180 [compost metagenome]